MQIKEITNQNCKYLIQTPRGRNFSATLSPATALGVRAFHRQLPGYKPTPLVRLERLVRTWGFKDIFVKDEAPRFGLKAFKVLGGSYDDPDNSFYLIHLCADGEDGPRATKPF